MAIPGWMKIWYRKPQWRDITEYSRQLNDQVGRQDEPKEPQTPSRPSCSIPSRLSLDRVLENKTCSPMSLQDFYMYLKYVEHSSENLEFYLWYKRYDANFPVEKRDPIAEYPSDDVASLRPYSVVSSVAEIVQGKSIHEGTDPDVEMSANLSTAKERLSSIPDGLTQLQAPCAKAIKRGSKWSGVFRLSMNSSASKSPNDKPSPCSDGLCHLDLETDDSDDRKSIFPVPLFAKPMENRAELDAAIDTFLLPGSEKELNISYPLRQRTLRRLQESSDPRNLKPVADHVYEVMRNCSHRNFAGMAMSTGTYETVCVGNLLGILNIMAGFLLVLLRALRPHVGAHSRFNVFYSFPLWAMGTMLMLLGTQGMCFIMMTLSKRQPLPWERFEEASVVAQGAPEADSHGPKSWWKRYRAFMGRTVAHDRHFRVEDRQIRRLQRMVLLQCAGGGLLAATGALLLFIFLPIWSETVPFKAAGSG